MECTERGRLCEDAEIETWCKRDDTDIRGEAGTWETRCGCENVHESAVVLFGIYVCK